jgi:hypothetical protein
MEFPKVIYQFEKIELSKRINELITLRGLTKADVIKSIGKERCDLNRFLKGNHNCRVETLFMLLGATQSDLPELIEVPGLRGKIRSLAEEKAMVQKYYESLKIK